MRRRRGRPGLLGTMARTAVITGTATAVHGSMTQKQQAAAAGQQQVDQMASELEAMKAKEAAAQQQATVDAAVAAALAQQSAAQAAPAPAAPAGGDDVMAQLEKLADMKAKGLLDDAEFAAMKAKLLA